MTDRLLKLAGLPAEKTPHRTLAEASQSPSDALHKIGDVWLSVAQMSDDPKSPSIYAGDSEEAVWRMLAEAASFYGGDDGSAEQKTPEEWFAAGHDAIVKALGAQGYDVVTAPRKQHLMGMKG